MSLHLTIATPHGETAIEGVKRVVLPGASGAFGVLAGHERFVSALIEGILEVAWSNGGAERLAIGGGYVEVAADRIVLLAEACLGEPGGAIAPARPEDAALALRLAQWLAPPGSAGGA